MRFQLAKCVWGREYVDTMLRFNIPSLLADGNLPTAATRATIEHVIHTTTADAPVIDAHPAYRALRAVVPCRIETLPEADLSTDYLGNINRMNAAHRRILSECGATGAAWLFDQPDHVWGNRSLTHLLERARSGIRCVMFAGIRTVRETMGPALESRRRKDALDIPHRDIVRLALDNLHAHDMARFWGPPVATIWPHHISWRVGRHSFLRRAFHPQPFLIAAPAPGVVPNRSVDDDFVDRAYPAPDMVEFIEDTDDFAVIEVSPRLHVIDHNEGRLSTPLLAAWAGDNLNPRKRAYFTHPIRFRGDELPERRWRRIEDFSRRLSETLERFQAFREFLAGLEGRRPALSRLLGRLSRDPLAHRRLRLRVPAITLRIPPETVIERHLHDDIGELCAFVDAHMTPCVGEDAPVPPTEAAAACAATPTHPVSLHIMLDRS